MLRNIIKLKQLAGIDIPINQAFVFTVDLSAEIIQLNCHWVSDVNMDSQFRYWCRTLESWSLRSTDPINVAAARQAIRNCLGWTMHNTLKEIRQALTTLKLSSATPSLSQDSLQNVRRVEAGTGDLTPPHSHVHSRTDHIESSIYSHQSVEKAVDEAAVETEEQFTFSSHPSSDAKRSKDVVSQPRPDNVGLPYEPPAEGSHRVRKQTPSMKHGASGGRQRKIQKK